MPSDDKVDVIDAYIDAERAAWAHVGREPDAYSITDMRDVEWWMNGDEEVCWYQDGEAYSAEVRRPGTARGEHYKLAILDSGFGYNIGAVFRLTTESTDAE